MDRIEDPRLQIMGQEWKKRSRELADWAMERLVNRRDVWGQYTGKGGAVTLPQRERRGSDMVTLEKLTRHFGSLRRNHLIGLHAQSAEETCLWLAVDIDLHDTEAFDAAERANIHFTAALQWWETALGMGWDPLLFDSNGAGGYHLLILFAEPAPMAEVHALGQRLIADWQSRNLDAPPETFPKAPRLKDDKLGAWLRLPGMHHTRDHFHRVWSGDDWLDDPWLDGNEAIDRMLQTVPGPPPRGDASKPLPPKPPPGSKPRRALPGASSRRPRICVDLDGVLATYDGWRGMKHIGAPVDGAVEFTRELAAWAEVVIFTSRCQGRGKKEGLLLSERKALVERWLEQHGFAWDEIYTGQGKPSASAYIDDRGVGCRPQIGGPGAYREALKQAARLSGRGEKE